MILNKQNSWLCSYSQSFPSAAWIQPKLNKEDKKAFISPKEEAVGGNKFKVKSNAYKNS